jgi:hypothetical protein
VHEGFDEEINIHADGLIRTKVEKAAVLYINNQKELHKWNPILQSPKHMAEYFQQISIEEQNRLLEEDSNNVSAWMATDSIVSIPNRLLRYDQYVFHSKVPPK